MLTVTIDCLPDCYRGRVHFSVENQIWWPRAGVMPWPQMTKPMTSAGRLDDAGMGRHAEITGGGGRQLMRALELEADLGVKICSPLRFRERAST